MIKRFPHYKQMVVMDCGATCLRMMFKFYEQTISIHKIRKLCQTTKNDVKLLEIKEAQLNGKKSGGIDLYVDDKESESNVTVIVDDIGYFLEDYHSKNKIIVKKFEGVHQGSPNEVKEYIATYGVNNSNHKPTKILIYEEYFRWKSVLGIYALFAIGILFIVFILLARIRVY